MTSETLPDFPIAEELFIIGNGFDLQCGLETTYYNFIGYILNKREQQDNQLSDDYEQIVSQYERMLAPELNADIRGYDWLSVKFSDFKYDINIWYRILLYEKLNKNSNWSSVEEVIATYLKNYDMISYLTKLFFQKKKKSSFSDNRVLPKIKVNNNSKSRNDVYYAVLYGIIFRTEDSLSLDSGKHLYSELKTLFSSPKQVSVDTVKELITSILLNELNELEYDFECFLCKQVNETPDYLQKVERLLEKLQPPLLLERLESDWDLNSHKNYHLLSFNFTSAWSGASGISSRSPRNNPLKYSDVHGRLPMESDAVCSTIIFGIDHNGIDATSLEYRFTKTYRTLKLYSTNLEGIGDDSDIYSPTIKKIKFYGHSLAEADYAYFQQIFDYYDLYNNQELALIFYYSVYDNGIAEQIEQNQMLAISRLIEKYGQTMDNQNHGKNLLTRLIQTNRLKLIKI